MKSQSVMIGKNKNIGKKICCYSRAGCMYKGPLSNFGSYQKDDQILGEFNGLKFLEYIVVVHAPKMVVVQRKQNQLRFSIVLQLTSIFFLFSWDYPHFRHVDYISSFKKLSVISFPSWSYF